MPRHKQEVINLLIIATEPVETVIKNVKGPFSDFSSKVSNFKISKTDISALEYAFALKIRL